MIFSRTLKTVASVRKVSTAVCALAFLAISSLATTSGLASDTAQWTPIASCNNGELVIDRNLAEPGKLQLVVNGRHAISTLLYPSYGFDSATQGLDLSFHNGGNTMVIGNLVGATRTTDFVHVYEGAGFYRVAPVRDINAITDLEFIGDVDVSEIPAYSRIQPKIAVSFFLDTKLGVSLIGKPGATPNYETLAVEIGFNSYKFYNCIGR